MCRHNSAKGESLMNTQSISKADYQQNRRLTPSQGFGFALVCMLLALLTTNLLNQRSGTAASPKKIEIRDAKLPWIGSMNARNLYNYLAGRSHLGPKKVTDIAADLGIGVTNVKRSMNSLRNTNLLDEKRDGATKLGETRLDYMEATLAALTNFHNANLNLKGQIRREDADQFLEMLSEGLKDLSDK